MQHQCDDAIGGRGYVPYANMKYGASGMLWEGRYKASLVQDEHYLLSYMRYTVGLVLPRYCIGVKKDKRQVCHQVAEQNLNKI